MFDESVPATELEEKRSSMLRFRSESPRPVSRSSSCSVSPGHSRLDLASPTSQSELQTRVALPSPLARNIAVAAEMEGWRRNSVRRMSQKTAEDKVIKKGPGNSLLRDTLAKRDSGSALSRERPISLSHGRGGRKVCMSTSSLSSAVPLLAWWSVDRDLLVHASTALGLTRGTVPTE